MYRLNYNIFFLLNINLAAIAISFTVLTNIYIYFLSNTKLNVKYGYIVYKNSVHIIFRKDCKDLFALENCIILLFSLVLGSSATLRLLFKLLIRHNI